MSTITENVAAGWRSAGVAILWFHAALYAFVAALGYFAVETLFGSAVILPTATAAAKWLAAAMLILALFMAAAARSGSPKQMRMALLGAFLFDLQAPVVMARYPAFAAHFEVDLGLDFLLVPVALFLLVGMTAFELSRVWRVASAKT